MCPFAHYDIFNTFCGCDITRGKRWAMKNDKDYAESSTRPDWCPLVEVPEPHGDLIDRDKLRAKEFIHNGDAYAVVMSRDIRNAPTVITESEEGE